MKTSDKIKALLTLKGVKHAELAEKLGMTGQALASKFVRGSFSVDDVIRIADILGVELSFTENSKTILSFDAADAAPPRRNGNNA